MVTIEIKKDDIAVGVLKTTERVFKTGSRGFFGLGKIEMGGKRYQVQVQLVEIGSRPKPGEEPQA